jgi:hypothetical protein
VVWISKSNRAALKRKARQRSRPFCIVFRLIAVALLNLPQAVILPLSTWFDRLSARARTRPAREFGVAELAIGIADQIAYVRVIVVAKCL